MNHVRGVAHRGPARAARVRDLRRHRLDRSCRLLLLVAMRIGVCGPGPVLAEFRTDA